MRFYYLPGILWLAILFYPVSGQETVNDISGYVFDKSTGKPVENVNVYIANTTWGSSTDSEGFFSIKNIPVGIHELVVSVVGYQYISKSILIKTGTHLQLTFRLKPVIYETEPTDVVGEIPRAWLADLDKFRFHFFGQSEFAYQCEITNPEVLDFTWTSSTYLTAHALQPLHIVNHALGITIDCILVHFSWDSKYKKWTWSIKPRFTFLEPADSSQSARWKQNRLCADQGSPYHFLLTLFERRLYEEGYIVYFVDRAGEKVTGGEYQFTRNNYPQVIKPGTFADEWKLSFKRYLYVCDINGRLSWLKLNYPEITVDFSGYPKEMNAIEVYGFWADQGVADLLPWYQKYTAP